jgi:hypothetical protein
VTAINGSGLAEEELIDAAFVAAGQPLNHADEADADGVERRKHETHRGIFFEPCRARDRAHGEHRETTDQRCAD